MLRVANKAIVLSVNMLNVVALLKQVFVFFIHAISFCYFLILKSCHSVKIGLFMSTVLMLLNSLFVSFRNEPGIRDFHDSLKMYQ